MSDTIVCPVADKTEESPSGLIPSQAATNELKKLFRHSGHYLSGILGSLALGFISFPIFTRLFSVSDYGTIDLIAKVLLLITALSKMGLQQSALRFYDGRLFVSDPSAARRYYSTMFCGMALTAAGATVLFLGVIGIAPKSLIDRPLATLLFLAAFLIPARATTSVLWVFLRVQEKTKTYSIFAIASKATTVAVVCLSILWLGRSVRSFYFGTILVEVTVAIILAALILRGGMLHPKDFDVTLFRAGLAFGLPLIFYELASIILDAGDRVLVRHYLGANPLGLYSVAYGMSDYVNNLLIIPINLALAPIYIRLWRTEGAEQTSAFLSRSLDLFAMASVGIFAVVAATSRDAVILFASPKYLAAGALIPTLVAGLLLYTSHAFLGAGLMIHKDSRTMAKVLAYSAIFNLAVNCILLPRIGLQAAAIATLLSYLLCILLLGRASCKLLPLKFDLRALAKYGFAALVAWYAASRVQLHLPLASLGIRLALASATYCGLMYAMDSRVRVMAAYLLRRAEELRHATG
jgi:O-antigen/teichoic acid export membrane protein